MLIEPASTWQRFRARCPGCLPAWLSAYAHAWPPNIQLTNVCMHACAAMSRRWLHIACYCMSNDLLAVHVTLLPTCLDAGPPRSWRPRRRRAPCARCRRRALTPGRRRRRWMLQVAMARRLWSCCAREHALPCRAQLGSGRLQTCRARRVRLLAALLRSGGPTLLLPWLGF